MSTRPALPRDNALPSVSVIVPMFNVAATLPTTLPAWLGQDHPAEWLLVDDGSTDDTLSILAALTPSSSAVRVLKHERNRGRAAARNTGIAAASGEVLLFLDADMRPDPDFVRQHAQSHTDPHVIGVVSNPILEGLDPNDPYHRYLRSKSGPSKVGPGQPLPIKYFIIGYTSVKASAVARIGGFDERFSYGEDLDFAYRLAQHYGEGLRFSERPVVHHYDHGSFDDRIGKLREFGRDNLPALLAKHPGLAEAVDIGFVDSRSRARTWRSSMLRWIVRPGLAASLRSLIPYAPSGVGNMLVRYVLAASITAAFRGAASTS